MKRPGVQSSDKTVRRETFLFKLQGLSQCHKVINIGVVLKCVISAKFEVSISSTVQKL